MAYQYKLLDYSDSDELSGAVTEHLAKGWDLWGNPFAVVEYGNQTSYFQAMVQFDPSGHGVVGQVESALSEPAGYSVQVPETPGADDFRDLGAAIGSMQTCGEGRQP